MVSEALEQHKKLAGEKVASMKRRAEANDYHGRRI